jgi:Rrf2 family protein
MLVLAQGDEGVSIMNKDIADKQNLPVTYLEQLMLSLRKAGLVVATRGAHGGYMLARSANDVNLAEIVEALEGELEVADCADVPNCTISPECCAIRDVFAEANKALFDVFRKYTLADLVHNQRMKEEERSPVYYI